MKKNDEVKEVVSNVSNDVKVGQKTIDEERLNELLNKEAELLKRKERERKYWKRSYYRAKLMKEKLKDLNIVVTNEEVDEMIKK